MKKVPGRPKKPLEVPNWEDRPWLTADECGIVLGLGTSVNSPFRIALRKGLIPVLTPCPLRIGTTVIKQIIEMGTFDIFNKEKREAYG